MHCLLITNNMFLLLLSLLELFNPWTLWTLQLPLINWSMAEFSCWPKGLHTSICMCVRLCVCGGVAQLWTGSCVSLTDYAAICVALALHLLSILNSQTWIMRASGSDSGSNSAWGCVSHIQMELQVFELPNFFQLEWFLWSSSQLQRARRAAPDRVHVKSARKICAWGNRAWDYVSNVFWAWYKGLHSYNGLECNIF